MKKCSYCGQQNADDSGACCGCNAEFQPPTPPSTDPRLLDPALSLITVAALHNLSEAKLLLTILESAGIEACIPEEYSAQVFSALIPFELVTVRVAAKDYEEAKAIVAQVAQAAPPSSSSEESDLDKGKSHSGQEPPPETA
jgi:hypothetical protein